MTVNSSTWKEQRENQEQFGMKELEWLLMAEREREREGGGGGEILEPFCTK